MPWRRKWQPNPVLLPGKWQPTPVLLPGESHGERSLVGYSPWVCKGHKRSDTTERLRDTMMLQDVAFFFFFFSLHSVFHGELIIALVCFFFFFQKDLQVCVLVLKEPLCQFSLSKSLRFTSICLFFHHSSKVKIGTHSVLSAEQLLLISSSFHQFCKSFGL